MSLTKSHQYLNYTDTQASTIAALGNAALVLGGKKAQNLKMIQKSLLFSLVANVIFRKLRFGIFVGFLENGNFSQFLKVEQKVSIYNVACEASHISIFLVPLLYIFGGVKIQILRLLLKSLFFP